MLFHPSTADSTISLRMWFFVRDIPLFHVSFASTYGCKMALPLFLFFFFSSTFLRCIRLLTILFMVNISSPSYLRLSQLLPVSQWLKQTSMVLHRGELSSRFVETIHWFDTRVGQAIYLIGYRCFMSGLAWEWTNKRHNKGALGHLWPVTWENR